MASNVSIPAGAMAAALAAAGKHDPNEGQVPTQTPTQSGAPSPVGGGQDAQNPTSAEDAQDGGQDDAAEQAIWSEFPSTDPNAVQALVSQLQAAQGDEDKVAQILGTFFAQGSADRQKFDQMQESTAAQLFQMFGGMLAPGGVGQPMPSGPSDVGSGPGVGGSGSGY